jgi:hypothetical protein
MDRRSLAFIIQGGWIVGTAYAINPHGRHCWGLASTPLTPRLYLTLGLAGVPITPKEEQAK